MPPSMSEICRADSPSASIAHTCIEPLRLDMNHISLPSAFQAGETLFDDVSVSSFDEQSDMS